MTALKGASGAGGAGRVDALVIAWRMARLVDVNALRTLFCHAHLPLVLQARRREARHLRL